MFSVAILLLKSKGLSKRLSIPSGPFAPKIVSGSKGDFNGISCYRCFSAAGAPPMLISAADLLLRAAEAANQLPGLPITATAVTEGQKDVLPCAA
jgi:hypothetical protein